MQPVGYDSGDDEDPADALRSKLHPEYFGRGSYKGALSSDAGAEGSAEVDDSARLAPEAVTSAAATPHER